MDVDEDVKKETTQAEPSIAVEEDMDVAHTTAEETEPSSGTQDEQIQIPLPPNETDCISENYEKMDANVTSDVPSESPDDNMDVETDVKTNAVKDECNLNAIWETEGGKIEQDSSINEQVISKIITNYC